MDESLRNAWADHIGLDHDDERVLHGWTKDFEFFEAGWNAARQWQPIETAPKDDTEILFFDGDVMGICWWSKLFDGWVSDYSNERGYKERPILWMPLPEPPKDAK